MKFWESLHRRVFIPCSVENWIHIITSQVRVKCDIFEIISHEQRWKGCGKFSQVHLPWKTFFCRKFPQCIIFFFYSSEQFSFAWYACMQRGDNFPRHGEKKKIFFFRNFDKTAAHTLRTGGERWRDWDTQQKKSSSSGDEGEKLAEFAEHWYEFFRGVEAFSRVWNAKQGENSFSTSKYLFRWRWGGEKNEKRINFSPQAEIPSSNALCCCDGVEKDPCEAEMRNLGYWCSTPRVKLCSEEGKIMNILMIEK